MKNKIYILVLLTIMISCKKQSELEKILIAKPDEAWVYYNPAPYLTHFTYYKFDKNGFCTRYERDTTNKFYKYEGAVDSPEIPQKWNVTNDSILKWGMHSCDVVSYNDDIIVLYNIYNNNYREERMIFLVKEKENNPRKYSNYFSQKRRKYPEKYK